MKINVNIIGDSLKDGLVKMFGDYFTTNIFKK